MKTRLVQVPGAAVLLIILLISALGVSSAFAADDRQPAPLETTLDHLSAILQRLEGELSALEAPRAERLEDGLEQMIELIEDVLEAFANPRNDGDIGKLKLRILRMDLALHRLVSALERLTDDSQPDHGAAREAIEDLRIWVDGYIEDLTVGLDPEDVDRLEAAAHEMMRNLAIRVAAMAEKARSEEADRPRLERLLNQLQGLVKRLDTLIRERFLRLPTRPR